ncbi:MAG TPA: hypothetical protein ENH84_07375 [Phycisphaerae bacterium]|nr:hypothetical protein [Phycisphaerae bacterium]
MPFGKRSRNNLELLNCACIAARYDRRYKITKQQLEQLARGVWKLYEVTEKICAVEIDSFV